MKYENMKCKQGKMAVPKSQTKISMWQSIQRKLSKGRISKAKYRNERKEYRNTRYSKTNDRRGTISEDKITKNIPKDNIALPQNWMQNIEVEKISVAATSSCRTVPNSKYNKLGRIYSVRLRFFCWRFLLRKFCLPFLVTRKILITFL